MSSYVNFYNSVKTCFKTFQPNICVEASTQDTDARTYKQKLTIYGDLGFRKSHSLTLSDQLIFIWDYVLGSLVDNDRRSKGTYCVYHHRLLIILMIQLALLKRRLVSTVSAASQKTTIFTLVAVRTSNPNLCLFLYILFFCYFNPVFFSIPCFLFACSFLSFQCHSRLH